MAVSDDSDVVLDHHDDRGTTRARRGAALFDVVVLSWAMGAPVLLLDDLLPVVADGALLLLWLLLVLVEGTTGASPGKHIAGVAVIDDDGRRPALLQAAVRRPWGWLLPLQLLGQPWIQLTTTAALLTMLVMLVTIERSPDRRGFHDRWAGTHVVEVEVDHRARLVVVLVTVALVLATLVLASTQTPIEAV